MTGKNLVTSFLQNTEDCNLLVCYEDIEFNDNSDRIFSYKINNSEYLKKWLEDNKNNIPEFYGGTAKNNDECYELLVALGMPIKQKTKHIEEEVVS